MAFAKLKTISDKKEAEELAGKWQGAYSDVEGNGLFAITIR